MDKSHTAAIAFRRQLREADDKFADAIISIMKTLRERYAGRGLRTPGVELPALVRHRWIADIPSFGSLAGPTPDLRQGRLTMTETRCVAARFAAGSWHAGPADDPTGEREPAIAVVTNRLELGRVMHFGVSLLALVALDAIADWYAAMGRSAGGDSVTAALVADLGALAATTAEPGEVGGFTCPGDGGLWRGEVVAVPGPKVRRYDNAPPPTVVMVQQLALKSC